VDRAAEILQAERRRRQTPDRGIGPTVLALLLLVGGLLLSQALILRDANQALIHQRDVAPELAQ
jgi:hypothetical protein